MERKECMEAQEAEDQYDLRICIAHVPTYFPEKLENYSFDLGLAGHTHGGIVRVPKLGPFIRWKKDCSRSTEGKLYACKQGDADCQPRTGRFQ